MPTNNAKLDCTRCYNSLEFYLRNKVLQFKNGGVFNSLDGDSSDWNATSHTLVNGRPIPYNRDGVQPVTMFSMFDAWNHDQNDTNNPAGGGTVYSGTRLVQFNKDKCGAQEKICVYYEVDCCWELKYRSAYDIYNNGASRPHGREQHVNVGSSYYHRFTAKEATTIALPGNSRYPAINADCIVTTWMSPFAAGYKWPLW